MPDPEKEPNLGPDALSDKQRTSSFVTKSKFEGEAFLGMSHHAMAAILDLTRSQLCLQSPHGAAHTVGAGERGGQEPPGPSDSERKTSISAHRLQGGAASRPLAALR